MRVNRDRLWTRNNLLKIRSTKSPTIDASSQHSGRSSEWKTLLVFFKTYLLGIRNSIMICKWLLLSHVLFSFTRRTLTNHEPRICYRPHTRATPFGTSKSSNNEITIYASANTFVYSLSYYRNDAENWLSSTFVSMGCTSCFTRNDSGSVTRKEKKGQASRFYNFIHHLSNASCHLNRLTRYAQFSRGRFWRDAICKCFLITRALQFVVRFRTRAGLNSQIDQETRRTVSKIEKSSHFHNFPQVAPIR